MAHVYVGFHDQRNSSRVLKPPGGGTSDIFGTDAPKVTKNNTELASTPEKNETNITSKPSSEANDQISNEENIKNGNCADNIDQIDKIDNLSKSDSEEPKIENLNITDENEGEKNTKNVEENQSESKTEIKPSATTESISSIIQQTEKQIEPEKRTSNRIPPGGYSSGLW